VGFTSLYDSGLGLVAYTEDTDFFTPTPLSGFTYDSVFAPMPSTFDANFAPLAGGITVTSGSTLAAVPEPGSVALFASIGAVAGFATRRKRRHA
jgi:PEP-CTERM motif